VGRESDLLPPSSKAAVMRDMLDDVASRPTLTCNSQDLQEAHPVSFGRVSRIGWDWSCGRLAALILELSMLAEGPAPIPIPAASPSRRQSEGAAFCRRATADHIPSGTACVHVNLRVRTDKEVQACRCQPCVSTFSSCKSCKSCKCCKPFCT
jgi:hypothetical protein